MTLRFFSIGMLALFLISVPFDAAAQAIGSFRWQLQPFCNVVSLNVTQSGQLYTLDGFDDQCGATQRAGVLGTAFQNPDGTIGLGLSIVAAPGGTPVHVDATISLGSLGGSWRDSLGNSGAFVFTPGAGVGGSARLMSSSGVPPGSITTAQIASQAVGRAQLAPGGVGSAQIDSTQVQLRVSAGCAPGQAVRVINQNGSVTCQADASGTGNITAVLPGSGLTGGATVGDATLAVAYAGSGAAATVARSDHYHGVGATNTAVGLRTLTAGTGTWNTAVGAYALDQNSTGDSNSALGFFSLYSNTTGQRNTGVGDGALYANAAGFSNTAMGRDALTQLSSGNENASLGYFAGGNLTSGSNNLYLASYGVPSESNTTRIGHNRTRTFTTGVRGVTTGNNNAVAVVIDSLGQLGTVSSTRRSKEDVEDLGAVGLLLQRLRPVQFRYRQPFGDGTKPLQFGLIAEEVDEVLPELVADGEDGQPATVKYHVLPSLLIAEVQRLERERAALASRLVSQQQQIEEQTRALDAIRATLDEMRASLATAQTSAPAAPRRH